MKYIKVKVKAKQKRESINQKSKDSFEVSVKEPALRNLANTRVVELVAQHFSVPVDKVRIVNGHHHPSKLLVIGD